MKSKKIQYYKKLKRSNINKNFKELKLENVIESQKFEGKDRRQLWQLLFTEIVGSNNTTSHVPAMGQGLLQQKQQEHSTIQIILRNRIGDSNS